MGTPQKFKIAIVLAHLHACFHAGVEQSGLWGKDSFYPAVEYRAAGRKVDGSSISFMFCGVRRTPTVSWHGSGPEAKIFDAAGDKFDDAPPREFEEWHPLHAWSTITVLFSHICF